MNKLILPLFILVSTFAFAEIALSDYKAIPMGEHIRGWDSPGFYLNISHEVNSFGYWDYSVAMADILEVSPKAYTFGYQTAPFFKIRTDKGEEHWVFGGDIALVSTDRERKESPYYNPESGHQHMQIFYTDGEFRFITSSNRSVNFDSETPPTDSIYFTRKETGYGEVSEIKWDRLHGNFFVGTYRARNTEKAEYDHESSYSLNLDRLGVKMVLQPEDEWFWYFYGEKDYDSILKLKALGYKKYESPYIERGESPFFMSMDDRDFTMIKFLIENGFSQTCYGGNYDATISCLWDPIKDGDLEMLTFLLEAGAAHNTGGELGTSWDLYRVIRYSTPEVLQLFLDNGYDGTHPTFSYSNGEDSGGSGNFLTSAISYGKPEMVKILIDRGANVNLLNYSYGFGKFTAGTPLQSAKSPEMTVLLQSYGARLPEELTREDYRVQGFGLSGKMNDTRVRYRNSPGTDGEILGLLDDGEELIVIDSRLPADAPRDAFPWYMVRRANGDFGWVYGEFVDVSRGFKSF